jgi:hypothetical protein
MNGTPIPRDVELGAALDALHVPEHATGFDRRLRRLLAEERLSRGGQRRASRRSRWARPRVLVLAAAALTLVAIALPLRDRVGGVAGTDVASAAEVKQTVRASLASMRSLSGVLVSRCTAAGCPEKGGDVRWRFTLSSRGDFRLVGPTEGEVVAYDAATGVVRTAGRSASLGGGPLFYAERRGVAPGLPDLGPPTWLLPNRFGAFVAALLAADDPRVHEVVLDGRPAWRLDVDAVPNAIVPDFTGDRFRITVDRETGMPVRVAELRGETLLREDRLEALRVNDELAPDAFRLAFPSGAEVNRTDEGFRRIGLNAVAGAVGHAPLVPSWVPGGYELAEVAVARRSAPTGAEAGNPESRGVVTLSYRRGLDQLVVSTRLAGDGSWSDPLATGEGYVDKRETVVVNEGALGGSQAELVIVPRGIPHAWSLGDGLVTTVAGPLGRADLLRVLESLERR